MFALTYVLLAQADVFGTVNAPPGVASFNSGGQIGLLKFISNLIKVLTVIAGLWGLFNVIGAGYTYLNSAGNPKATEQAIQQLLNSAIGLMIIVGSFTIISIISYLMFGNAMFILNPTIPSATGQ
jgi:uncharacterized membrane protein